MSQRLLTLAAVSLLALTYGFPVHAQERPPDLREGAAQPGLGRVMATTRDLFNRPLHPLLDTIATGGWMGAGIGFDPPSRGGWSVSSKALVTLHKYWLAGAEARYTRNRLDALAYARARDMSRLSFFGLGADSEAASRTSFTLQDPLVGVVAAVRIFPNVSVGGRWEESWPAVESGADPRFPSIEQRFTEAEAPGLSQQPRFGRYEGFVEATVDPPDGWSFNQGGTYRVSYDLFDDQQLNQFDFQRLQLEARHRFAGFRPQQTLTLRGWVSSAEPLAGSVVPFYLQHTLGGTGNIRSVDDAPVGGDRTAATLRGFANLRYRDNHMLLLQAEYRWNVWGPVETTIFVDTGKVASRRSDLNLSHLQTNYGFSINVLRAADTIARVDVGFGGEDGARVFFNMGGLLR
jgi:hypothetical protein